jgi:hypothetical protein
VKVCKKEKRVVSMYVCVCGVCVCVYICMYVGGEGVEVAASFFFFSF